jgi:hypothetical protein
MIAPEIFQFFEKITNPNTICDKLASRDFHPGDLIPSCHQTGGTGVSPVQAQAEACGYKK